MEKVTRIAALPIDTALERLLLAKRKEVDRECERFVRVGDPESLHDLRVAMRRLHSLFIGFNPCFKADTSQAESLHALFQETNHARDLEVTLALLDRYQLALPWLKNQWQCEIDIEYQRLRQHLPSGWWPLSTQFETAKTLFTEPLPEESIGSYAAKHTRSMKKKLFMQVKLVCTKWDDKRAHKLRIRGKRIRYLLEPFAEEQPQIGQAVNQLKRFQDLLGEYHDLVVLRQRLKRLQHGSPLSHYNALSLARRQLKQVQQDLRHRIRNEYLGKPQRKLDRVLTETVQELAQVRASTMIGVTG